MARTQALVPNKSSGPDHILWVEDLVSCIREGKEPVLSVEHAVHVLEIVERAAQSSLTGEILELESTFPGPPCRVAVPDVPIPYARPLEYHVLPTPVS